MLFLGADHAGFALKTHLKKFLTRLDYQVEDVGAQTLTPGDDYPNYAMELAKRVRRTTGSMGILICGSGVGMSIVANKFAGIRAVNVWTERVAKMAREEEDANVLVLPAKLVTRADAEAICRVWLRTSFRRIPRYRRRLSEIARIEHNN